MPPKISICIPTHKMKNKDFFLERVLNSVRSQTFQDYEIVVTEKGLMAENTNAAMKEATGEYIKILYMDDFLTDENSLQNIWDGIKIKDFTVHWAVSPCTHEPGGNIHKPYWNDDITKGKNTIGSPSVVTIRRESLMYFDERMSWLLDCDLYKRLHDKYGGPVILNDVAVTIGLHDGQMSNILTDEEKLSEHDLIKQKYE